MAGTGPKLPSTPLELLINDGTRKPTILHGIWGYIVGGSLTLGGMLYVNYAAKRPLASGVHKTAIATVLGALFGNYLDTHRTAYYAERDAMMRHYIQLHPEDFPPYERKKFSEVLDRWTPIR